MRTERPRDGASHLPPGRVDGIREKPPDALHFLRVTAYEHEGNTARAPGPPQQNPKVSPLGQQSGEVDHDDSRRMRLQGLERPRIQGGTVDLVPSARELQRTARSLLGAPVYQSYGGHCGEAAAMRRYHPELPLPSVGWRNSSNSDAETRSHALNGEPSVLVTHRRLLNVSALAGISTLVESAS